MNQVRQTAVAPETGRYYGYLGHVWTVTEVKNDRVYLKSLNQSQSLDRLKFANLRARGIIEPLSSATQESLKAPAVVERLLREASGPRPEDFGLQPGEDDGEADEARSLVKTSFFGGHAIESWYDEGSAGLEPWKAFSSGYGEVSGASHREAVDRLKAKIEADALGRPAFEGLDILKGRPLYEKLDRDDKAEVDKRVKAALKSKEAKESMRDVAKKVLNDFYRTMYTKRGFWMNDL